MEFGEYDQADPEDCQLRLSSDEIYQVVSIDNIIWLAQNLHTKPANGQYGYDYRFITDVDQNTIQKYLSVYGYLYNYDTAQEICPAGWHLPSKAEFQSLLDFVGNTPQLRADNLRHSDPATNCTYNYYDRCNSPELDFTGDDTYGFGAVAWPLQSEQVWMPGFADQYASFWTTEKLTSEYFREYAATTYYGYILYVDLEKAAVEKVAVDRQYFNAEHNVRCIKD